MKTRSNKKTGHSTIALILIAALGACSSQKKPIHETTPIQSTASPTVYRPAPVQPAWCTALREYKSSSDKELAVGDLDQVFLSVAALQPYDKSPGVLQVIADVFALYEADSEAVLVPQADYAKLQADETASLAVCP